MHKEAIKDSFGRVLQQTDEQSLWDNDEIPYTESWETMADSHFWIEMDRFLAKNRRAVRVTKKGRQR